MYPVPFKKDYCLGILTMCIPIWFGFAPHGEDGYGLSPAKRISKVGAVAMLVMFIGWIIELVAITTTHWSEITWFVNFRYGGTIRKPHGLWSNCDQRFFLFPNCQDTQGWLVAVRALNVIGMMFGSGALVFMGLYTFLNSEKWDRIFKSSALTSAILAGVLVIIGAIVYGASINQGKAPIPYNVIGTKYLHDFSWSFALSIIAAIFFVISGVLMGFARKPRIVTS